MIYRFITLISLLTLKGTSLSFCYASNQSLDSTRNDSLTVDSMKFHHLQETTITATRLLLVTRKDTTIYDLDALDLKSSALLRDAFEKLPGMSFRNGLLYHNGREVKRILINGMDFSQKNPMLALQALPSYIMKNVKVYERKSDFAMRYDIDDGREELVADVSVRKKYMGVWTGEIAVGGGTDERFMGKAFGNTFTDQFRVSLFGNANNINEQMWYNGDGKERAGEMQAGDNQFYTPGATFFWKNKKGIKDKGYFKVEGGLDYNKEIYDQAGNQWSELYLSDGSMFSANDSRRNTHTDRIAGHIKTDWNITKALTLNYLGSFDVSNSKDEKSTLKANWNENPLPYGGNISDTLESLLIADSQHPKAIDLQQEQNSREGNGLVYSHNLKLWYNIPNTKTFFQLGHNVSIGKNDTEEYDDTYYKYFNEESQNSRVIDRFLKKAKDSRNHEANARVMQYFKVKGFKRFCVYVEYMYNKNKHSADEMGYLAEQTEGNQQNDYSVEDETTRNWWDESWQHSVETSLSLGKGIYYAEFKPCFNFRHDEISYTKRNLATLSPHKNYKYVSLQSLFRIRSEKFGTLRCQYFITPNIPDIHSFVTYPDMADPQYIILGNENLDMGLNHSLATWYSRNFTKENENGKITRTLSAHAFFKHSSTSISNSTTYDRTTGVITVKPVNISGNWNGVANIGFTTPLDVTQRFWLETFAEATVLRTQTYSGVMTVDNTEQQFNDNRLYSYSVTVKPRLKFAPVDFSVAYELRLEDNKGTYASVNNKIQWQHHIQGKFNWEIPWDLNFDATVNYQNYTGYISGKRENWVMMDMGIERAFLKNENLFVRISGHDLFNQNDSFLREYSATALTHTYQKTLGRYGMLTLRYRFSSKKK